MRKGYFVTSVVFVIAICCLAGCGSGSSSGGGGGGTATSLKGLADCSAVADAVVICGTALASDGITPIVGAEVSYMSATSSENVPLKGLYKLTPSDTSCLTDDAGQFACSAAGVLTASGTYSFRIVGGGFTIDFSISTTAGETTPVPAADTTATASESTAKWLVVPGAYDGVQLLLAQLKGCTLTGDATYPSELRGSTECETAKLYVLADYDSTTLDSTFSSVSNLTTYSDIFVNCVTDMSSYASVLQSYVEQGGNLYFSDLADPGITAAFPGIITFPDSYSTSTGDVTADVDQTGLATFLGGSTVNIEFDLPGWQPISAVGSNVTTYISGDTSSLGGSSDAPITVGWKQGSGGCIFYTSYHIEGASSGSGQEKALKYLILNVDSVCQ